MIRPLLRATTILALGLMLHVSASAETRALSPTEVKRIVDAPKLYSYIASGETKSVYRGKPVSLGLKVIHKKPDKHRMEYLSAPLKDVVIVSDGSRTWRCDPRAGTVGSPSGRGDRERKLGLFLDNHVVQKVGSDRTAGRSAYILAIKSTSGQLRKKMWVDASTHIVLRSEDYDPRGKVLSATNYRSIKYNPSISDQLFKPADDPNCSGGACKTMSRDELSKAVGFSVRTPGYVPKGYRLENYRLYDCPCKCGHKSAYLRYTNGMSGISIFETRADSGCATDGNCGAHGGKCIVGSQMVAKTSSGISFVVMGNVKSTELKKIADSLR